MGDTIAYAYNNRSELTNAVAAFDSDYRYAYEFDDIGNRESSSERGTNSVYTANSLNQYTAVDDFTPQFDDDGNQTLIKTGSGVWQVTYNGENRPVMWVSGTTNIVMSFDCIGRRVAKNDMRFLYDGYQQIARVDYTRTNYDYFVYNPTESIAIRHLVWDCNGTTSYYTHDGNKNVSEIIPCQFDNRIAAHYEYAPFGAIQSQWGMLSSNNPWRFSNEYTDDVIGTIYYTFRHYDLMTSRWLCRDPINEIGNMAIKTYKQIKKIAEYPDTQLYIMVNNDPIDNLDDNGLIGHIAGGALVGCTAGATYSLITSWLGGDSACQCSCKAFGSCAVGAVFGAMGAAQPAWAGCLAGMSSNIINLGVSSVCDKACGKPQEQKGICVILNIMISGSVSCMAGPLASAPAGKMQAFAANFISNVIGFDVLSYCGLSN